MMLVESMVRQIRLLKLNTLVFKPGMMSVWYNKSYFVNSCKCCIECWNICNYSGECVR